VSHPDLIVVRTFLNTFDAELVVRADDVEQAHDI
jgi:hypothetical protein